MAASEPLNFRFYSKLLQVCTKNCQKKEKKERLGIFFTLEYFTILLVQMILDFASAILDVNEEIKLKYKQLQPNKHLFCF